MRYVTITSIIFSIVCNEISADSDNEYSTKETQARKTNHTEKEKKLAKCKQVLLYTQTHTYPQMTFVVFSAATIVCIEKFFLGNDSLSLGISTTKSSREHICSLINLQRRSHSATCCVERENSFYREPKYLIPKFSVLINSGNFLFTFVLRIESNIVGKEFKILESRNS